MADRISSLFEPLLSERGFISRILCGFLFTSWLVGVIFPWSAQYLALVANNTITVHHAFWNVFTAGFFEISVFMLVVNLVVVALIGPILERNWGDAGFLKFLGIVNLATGVGMFFFMVTCFYLTGSEWFILCEVCGFSGLTAAFAVAMKQRYGEKVLFSFPAGIDFAVKHIPMVLFTASIIFWVLGGPGKESFNILLGTYFGWVYLRFFDVSPEGIVGDPRDEFALVTFYPAFLRPLVHPVAAACFTCFSTLGCFSWTTSLPTTSKSSVTASLLGSSSSSGSANNGVSAEAYSDKFTMPFGVTADPIAERRRALAIKAIDDKLAALSRSSSLGQALPGAASTGPTVSAPQPSSTASPLSGSLEMTPSSASASSV